MKKRMKRKINKENVEEKKEGKVFVYGAILLVIIILSQLTLFLFNLKNSVFGVHAVITLLQLIFTLWHAIIKNGLKNTIVFFLLSTVVSFLSEFIGVNFGSFFGGAYRYSTAFGPTITAPGVVILNFISFSPLKFFIFICSIFI